MRSNVAALQTRPVARLFKALGDENRLRIVALLAHGELCVCHIEAALKLTQPNASRLLSVLKNAGVVEPRRDGSWVYYRLAAQVDEFARSQLKSLAAVFGKQDTLREDVQRLLRTRGPNSCK